MKFEDMDVWKEAARLSVSVYRELAELRDYGFRDQITRSGLSIPSNIAEVLVVRLIRISAIFLIMPGDHVLSSGRRRILA